jgi:uncharacterized protein (TIGR00369 family)
VDDSPDPELTAQIAAAAPLASFLDIEMISATPHEVRARLAWDAAKCTVGGILHGGVLMAFADTLGGTVAYVNLPEDANGTATIESKTNFFAAVRGGYVHAVARPLHTGRRTIVVDTELYDDAGKLVARVTQTQAVL